MKYRICAFVLLLALLLSLSATVSAGSFDGEYVLDEYGLLWEEEKEELENLARELEELYSCGIYVATVEDYRDYHEDVYYAAVEFYKGYDLGCGSNNNGMLLLLSMEERDFAIFIYGDEAEAAITEQGRSRIEDAFLDDFREDDWYGGLLDYYEQSGQVLARAQAGDPVTSNRSLSGQELLIAILAPLMIALVVCLIQRGKMKTAKVQTQARAYVPAGGVKFNLRRDRFTHITRSRVKVESSSSGSQSRSGGGGHGSSGKF